MTKAPIALQELRRRIYWKAKSEKAHRFWGIFVHVTRKETLEEAYRNVRHDVLLGKMVDTLKGEAFGFLGFDLRRVHKRKKDGYTIQMTPKKKARKVVKAKIRDIIRSGGATPVAVIVARVNAVVAGWVNYFRVGNSSRAFSEVRDYLEMKIRTLLTRRKRRRKTSIGWRRWSNAYVYGLVGLYWDWKIHPLPSATAYA